MTPEIQRKYAHLVLETTPGPHNHMMAELAERHRMQNVAEAAFLEVFTTGVAWTVIEPMPVEPAADQAGNLAWPFRTRLIGREQLFDMLENGHL